VNVALTIGELVAYIRADNRGFRRGTREAHEDMERLQRDANGRLRDMRGRFVAEGRLAGRGFGDGVGDGQSGVGRLGKAAMTLLGQLGGLAGTALRSAVQIAAVGATAISAAPLVVAAAVAVGHFVAGLLSAAPALLAFAAAGLFVKATLAQIFKEGSAARTALQPIADRFTKAGEAASRAAARGIRPLAEDLARVAGPSVQAAMVKIGQATNTVMRQFLGWARSAKGLRAIRGILDPIGATVQGLAPHVSRLAISFVSLLGRITGVSLAAGRGGLARVLDLISAKLDALNAATVSGGLAKLRHAFDVVSKVASTLVGWVRKIVEAYRMYTGQFKLVADAVSVAAMIFGGPIVTIIAGIGLIIRHFDQFKAAYQRLKASLSSPVAGGMFAKIRAEIPRLRALVSQLGGNFSAFGRKVLPEVKKAFTQITASVLPRLEDIYRKVTGKLLPAFGEFVQAAAPVVAFFVRVFGPYVAATLSNLLRVIGGFVDIVTGIFQVLTGILTGDWHKVWDGLKNIAGGAVGVIGGIVRQLWNLIASTFRLNLGVISALWTRAFGGLGGTIRGALGGIIGAARSIFTGVTGVIRAAMNVISTTARAVWRVIVAIFTGNLGQVKAAIRSGASQILGAWRGLGNALQSLGRAVWNNIRSAFRTGMSNARSLISGGVSAIRGAWSAGWSAVRSTTSRAMSSLVSSISSGASRAAGVARRIPGMLLNALGNLGGLLVSAGAALIRGLISGIESMLGSLKSKLNSITNLIPGWKGPPSKDRKLLYKTGRLIMRGLINGMTGSVDDIRATAQRITELIKRAFAGKHTKVDDRLLAALKKSTAKLVSLANKRDKILARIAEAKQFAADVTSNARQFAGLTSLDFGTDADGNALPPTAKGIQQGLQGKLAQLKAFAANIRKLAAKGLGKSLLRQLLEAGPEAGGPLAAALAAADSATFGSIKKAQADIDAISTSLGKSGADILYDSGKGAARGFLTGLQQQQKAIEAQMDKIARNFAKQIARAFGVKLPTKAPELHKLNPTPGPRGSVPVALHVENYHEAPRGSARATAEQLLFLTTARG
jgi:phage-related protein